ncbi:MAG: YceI family protein [Pseudomonadota bacterium]
MPRFTLPALVISTALSAVAVMPAHAADIAIPSGTYAIDAGHTSLFWSVSHFGFSNYTARLNSVDATVELNAEDITQSSLTATIDMTSVNTDYPFAERTDFDEELRGEQWLNAGNFPEATFTSTEIVKTGDSTATITGDLTFLGVTLPMTLDAELIGFAETYPVPVVQGAVFGVQATGTFDRTEFGFATFAPNIGAEVTIELNAEFIQQ